MSGGIDHCNRGGAPCVQGGMSLSGLSRPRPLVLALTCTALLAVALVLWFRSSSDVRSRVVLDERTQEGWKSVEYDDVRVDVPSTWVRSDLSDCEFQFERWARPGSATCEADEGVAFYGSATFDPSRGPGIRRADHGGSVDGAWAGYVLVGDVAVYVSDADRDVAEHVLASARVVTR